MSLDACISCLPYCMHSTSFTLHAFHIFHIACRVVEPEDEVVPLRLARIDAARGIGERIEYEVPMDPAGMGPAPDPKDCCGRPHCSTSCMCRAWTPVHMHDQCCHCSLR